MWTNPRRMTPMVFPPRLVARGTREPSFGPAEAGLAHTECERDDPAQAMRRLHGDRRIALEHRPAAEPGVRTPLGVAERRGIDRTFIPDIAADHLHPTHAAPAPSASEAIGEPSPADGRQHRFPRK